MNNNIVELDGRILFLQCPYFWNSHFLLSSGCTCHVLSSERCSGGEKHDDSLPTHWCTLQKRQRLGEPSFCAKIPCAKIILQMAQLSTTVSQAQRATTFHFFTSKHFLLVCCGCHSRCPLPQLLTCWKHMVCPKLFFLKLISHHGSLEKTPNVFFFNDNNYNELKIS